MRGWDLLLCLGESVDFVVGMFVVGQGFNGVCKLVVSKIKRHGHGHGIKL